MKILRCWFGLITLCVVAPAMGQIVSISDNDSLLGDSDNFRDKPNIAVLPFYDANAQAKEVEFGRTVSAMLATALRSNTNFNVLERGELNQIIMEKAVGISGITHEITQSFGDLYNVEVLLSGDVSLINTTLHIDARLIDTKSSKIVVALYSTCQDLKRIREVVVRLAEELEQTYLRQWMGSIRIISDPAGAEVYLDENFVGITVEGEPLVIDNMLEGNYPLKFIRGGYYNWEGEIAVLAKMERSVKVSLIAKPGAMNIYSEPAGAKIYVDNNIMGETPLSLRKVAEGEHEIRLVKEKYKEWAQRVIVRSFQPTDVKATLEVSPGMLTITSIPGDADIIMKGNFVAKTPHTLTNIKPGEAVVQVEKEGYEAWTTSVFITPNGHETLDLALKEKRGSFSVSSKPENASVYLMKNGENKKEFIGLTPVLNYSTTIGTYLIEVAKENYYNNQRTIEISHNDLIDIGIKLEERPGSVLATTSPQNARIFLDGIFRGRSEIQLDQIPKGTYQVYLSMPFDEYKHTIEVKPNQVTEINYQFKKSNDYLIPAAAIGCAIIALSLISQ